MRGGAGAGAAGAAGETGATSDNEEEVAKDGREEKVYTTKVEREI
jgi:hypothetical protein